MEKSIIIGADIAFIGVFENFDIDMNMGEKLKEVLFSADYRIYDLELPLTYTINAIPKIGPNLKMKPSEIVGLKQLEPDLLITANNHMMDYGVEGVKSTIDILEQENISIIGSGISKIDSTYSIKLDNYKIGIYVGAEKEFVEEAGKCHISIFDENAINQVRELKEKNDYVIAIYHGGVEHFEYPGDYLIRRCHALVDGGADLVLCQHNHIIGVYENYRNAIVLYGQGNFIADYNYSNIDYGLLTKITFINENKPKMEFIPIKKDSEKVDIPTKEESFAIIEQLKSRSKNDFSKKYRQYVNDEVYRKLQGCCGMSDLLKKIDNHTNHFLIKLRYKKKDLLLIQNLLRCDVHRNGIVDGIGTILK